LCGKNLQKLTQRITWGKGRGARKKRWGFLQNASAMGKQEGTPLKEEKYHRPGWWGISRQASIVGQGKIKTDHLIFHLQRKKGKGRWGQRGVWYQCLLHRGGGGGGGGGWVGGWKESVCVWAKRIWGTTGPAKRARGL